MNPAAPDRLLRGLSCSIRLNEPLAPYTTFQIGGPADILAEVRSVHELAELHRRIQRERVPYFYLGHGSNILVSDAGFRGIVIRATEGLARIKLENGIIHAGPGARLLDLTLFAAKEGLSGIEQLSGIPGSVGGGLYMNAGAYGKEICEAVSEVDFLNAEGHSRTLSTAEIGFGYRSAPALQKGLILESRYKLVTGNRIDIYKEMRRVWKLRRAKQPLEYPSAGSIFKRPPGDYAGRLIEDVGGKGTRIGGAMVPFQHAGIFVNTGGATAADVSALVREIRRRVWEKHHILLETEVKPVGFQEDPFAIAL